jgi:hypothetical protein
MTNQHFQIQTIMIHQQITPGEQQHQPQIIMPGEQLQIMNGEEVEEKAPLILMETEAVEGAVEEVVAIMATAEEEVVTSEAEEVGTEVVMVMVVDSEVVSEAETVMAVMVMAVDSEVVSEAETVMVMAMAVDSEVVSEAETVMVMVVDSEVVVLEAETVMAMAVDSEGASEAVMAMVMAVDIEAVVVAEEVFAIAKMIIIPPILVVPTGVVQLQMIKVVGAVLQQPINLRKLNKSQNGAIVNL